MDHQAVFKELVTGVGLSGDLGPLLPAGFLDQCRGNQRAQKKGMICACPPRNRTRAQCFHLEALTP